MTIKLPPELEDRLKRAASQHGLDASEYAARLIDEALPPGAPDQATLDLLASWDAEDATDDPAEIERRRRELEEFKEAMNRSRRDTAGPEARTVYP